MMNIEEFGDRLAEAGDGKLKEQLKLALVEVQMNAVRYSVLNATKRMKVRTGALRGSIRVGFVRTEGDDIAVSIKAGAGAKNIRYARIQELGGTIKGRPYLRIPLGPSLMGTGVDRYPGPLRQSAPGKFRVVREKGKLFLANNKTNQYWYILARTVTIKGKHYLRDGLTKAAKQSNEIIHGSFRIATELK